MVATNSGTLRNKARPDPAEFCFDSIPHERLMRRVEERISDGAVLELIAKFLKQDIMQEGRSWTPAGGTP